MIVYHGSTMAVREPDVLHSYRMLDFGKGFYVTTVLEQAERWGRRKEALFGGNAVVNQYEMEDISLERFQVKRFPDDLKEWLDFVCACRDGGDNYKAYDVIVGKVADDKVYRVVDMYHSGAWDKERALLEIRAYPNYDQIAFITQQAIDESLRFDSCWEV